MKKKRSTAKTLRIILFIAFLFFGIAKLLISPEQAADVFGRIGGTTAQYFTGIYQIISAILVIMPSTAFIGALMAAVSMTVAIILHFTVLGFEGPFLVLTILAFIILFISFYVIKCTRGMLFHKK